MRALLLAALLLLSQVAHAHKTKSKWSRFCNRYLSKVIDWSPEDELLAIDFIRYASQYEDGSLNVNVYVDSIVQRYRATGGKLHWMHPDGRLDTELLMQFKVLEAELRVWRDRKDISIESVGKIVIALQDYSHLIERGD